MQASFRKLLLIAAAMVPAAAFADGTESREVLEAVERHLSPDTPLMPWVKDPARVDADAGDKLELRETEVEHLETIKLTGVVPPILFESGIAQIPATTVDSLQTVLDGMRDRLNVRLHLVGHADNRPLSPRLQAIYGDNGGLSRERAGQVAEYLQGALGLPADSITYEWAGDLKPVASNLTPEGRAKNRRVEVEVWYDEPGTKLALQEVLVEEEFKQVKVCRVETLCKLRYVDGHSKRARIQNVVAPIYYDEETISVDDAFVERVREGLSGLADKKNLVMKLVGYSDDAPLNGRAERIYGDSEGLSKAMARRAALVLQDELDLPTERIQSDGRGAERPLASNNTPRGRALNRRVEVEFWYDDPLNDLPDEPQLCPESDGAELVTRIYEPTWGSWPNLAFEDGRPVIPAGLSRTLERALNDIADRTNPRLRFVGFTRNETLARRTAAAYGDDVGLSASRARRAMEIVASDMQLVESQTEFEGRGYVHADDPVNAGFVQGETSHVTVQVVYDELAILDDYEGVDIKRLTREIKPGHPLALNLMRITVDGEPIDDPKRSSADIQRCTDVALDEADIQFGFDNMRSAPRLSVTATPSTISLDVEDDSQPVASDVHFRMYTNYSHFIERAEVRVFRAGASLQSEPLFVVDVDADAPANWLPPGWFFKGPVDQLTFVLRAYGHDGNFDETDPQPLWVVYDDVEPDEASEQPQDLLAAYGENRLQTQNIGLSSGTVSVRGSDIPDGHQVYVAGRPVPVDADGSFVTEEILPTGAHTVEVAVIDEEGAGELYLRDLEFEPNDWFYVGMAELTLSENSTSGPMQLFDGDNSRRYYDSSLDGRLAFFVNGKFGHGWRLTASADTREAPLDELFSNFMDKSPESLFRRIDPDYYYPTFGDDGTVEEMAPTLGKFFVRASKDDNYAQWGSFSVGYMDNELAQVDRGLYGANVHVQSQATTDFGDQRYAVDLFAAEPGTLGSREEFRGTGGSLYFLERQDILAGSERVRIEVRDKASGLVTGVINLAPAIDYDIDYLQGRILLSEPLASTAADKLLVRSSALAGDEAYLVVRYEYTPGFDEVDVLSTGVQAHYWFGNYVRLGATVSDNDDDSGDSSLEAADLTLRYSANTWLKHQTGTSDGLVSLPKLSDDGGFEFASFDPSAFVNASASAARTDLSVASSDLLGDVLGYFDAKLTLYTQSVDAGYSAPGLTALSDIDSWGGTLSVPIMQYVSIDGKFDYREQAAGLETEAEEINFRFSMTERWDFSAGFRRDFRLDNAVLPVLTQEQGERSDAVLQVGYDSRGDWSSYAFVQDTLSVDGNREENGRVGFGGSFRVMERLHVDAEVSDGDLGAGGRVGTNYIHSDSTSVYLNYALENERTDNGLRGLERGREGNLVAGMKTRLSDSTSVFLEERYQHRATQTGLTHASGVNFTPTDHVSFGVTTDIGTLIDSRTAAETDRVAGGVQFSVSRGDLQLSSAVEYRKDVSEQPDLGENERKTWLFRNNVKYQINDSGRIVGKLNHSTSDSSLGGFYDGGFTETVLGYAYRPVRHDRLNVLAKYTYFYNGPTTGQLTQRSLAAEFVQKSHIASIDVGYELTRNLSIGGKYAYRLGQLSLDRDAEQFFDNNATLLVARTDFRFGKHWELTAEARNLSMPDLDENKSGALLTVSRYLGDNLKLGAGYNFTDFSDDLTDLSFDHHGFFVTITGAL